MKSLPIAFSLLLLLTQAVVAQNDPSLAYTPTAPKAPVAIKKIYCIRCPFELGPNATYTDTLMCQERFFRAEMDGKHYDAAIMWLLAEWVNYQVSCQADITPTVTLEGTKTVFARKDPDFEEFMNRLIAQFPTLTGE